MSKYIDHILTALITWLVLYISPFWPDDPIVYSEVVVPARVIIEREPDTVRTFVDRIRTVNVAPTQRARAPEGGMVEVQDFCRPTVLAIQDTIVEVDTVPDPRLLLRSISHSPGWFVQKDNIFISGPTSYGDLVGLDYNVRPGFTVRTVGDSLIVQYPRVALLREGIEALLPLAIGLSFCAF